MEGCGVTKKTPQQRCIEALKQQGYIVDVVERIEYERELILKTHAQMLERGMIEVKKC